ncbi:hypothetical protein PGTUg99_002308 [Puccinia graminis f. sp. tritici]|uniref:RFX1-4/6/8-like BCD domain-containing protein n=1 Tax=Puccinia graminis f. sp. tritici TaxID=56615 RepID=A0A5B0LV96_PUCGR|nr:hypothetical protein PGTUg99_034658 [Puccinia graminis f. sp. tritici]KAA1103618.1 hypothetical protein PGTUg99_002308 [Puccinia graminis f. sp. tritici]
MLNCQHGNARLAIIDPNWSCRAWTSDLDHQKAREFWSMYVDHLKNLLDSIKSYWFDQFKLALRTFWTSMDSALREFVTHSLMMSLTYQADAVVYNNLKGQPPNNHFRQDIETAKEARNSPMRT